MADDKNGAQAAATAESKGKKRRRKKLTKIEAVKRAMAALGAEASRSDIQGYVRQKFGVQTSLHNISKCKGELAKRAARDSGAATKARKATTGAGNGSAVEKAAAQPPAKAPSPARTPQARTTGGGRSAGATIRLEDALLAKKLLDRVGAAPLRTLIDGLAK